MSVLIPALAKLGPRVIAIDKFYSEGACSPKQKENTHLADAVNEVPANVSVVVGQATHQKLTATSGPGDDCLVLTPPFAFAVTDGPNGILPHGRVSYGLTRLNENTLQIPLAWAVFQDDRGTNTTAKPGFALVAAERAEPSLLDDKDLVRIANEPVQTHHPFGFFEKNIPERSAMEVLCKQGQPQVVSHGYAWDCPPGLEHRPLDFSAKVVVVGEHVATDYQPSLAIGCTAWISKRGISMRCFPQGIYAKWSLRKTGAW